MSDGWPDGWARNARAQGRSQTEPLYTSGYGGSAEYADPADYARRGPAIDPYDGGPYDPYEEAPPGRRRRRKRRWPRVLAVLLVLLLGATIGFYFYLDSRLQRENVLTDYAGRPADTPGTNWLVVGSDSRAGLTAADRKRLRTGNAQGRRTDSMMLVHYGSGGTTLVSLPRDSYVPIPGRGSNKLNAAFAFGGPQLLVRTVEQATGIRIDHYAEIGFGGFVGVVDAVGGVNICAKQAVRDPKAGLNIKAGCQNMDGSTALGFVRTRAFARADLERVENQRQFFAALMKKATSPSVMFNPFRSIPMAMNATSNFAVDDDDHLYDLTRLMWAMRSLSGGGGTTTTVPIGGTGSSAAAGSYITWDRTKASALFDALKNDQPVPANVVTK